jgi:2-polyprenyl-3-methyl-5-hydroxy-6-metoxy-1,4-benzoquinol methylase|tara:strand:- start:331 stop:1386 length:1056 start_codon:yes stop_codon:yes gene_type:complete
MGEQIKEENKESIGTHALPACPLCGCEGTSVHTEMFDRMFKAPGKWSMSKCDNSSCGLLWLNPMPNDDELWKIYVEYYTHGSEGKYTFDFIRKIENKYYELAYGYKNLEKPSSPLPGFIVNLFPTEKSELDFRILGLDAKEGGKMLDIGCGNGHLIKRLMKMGWDVEGMDFDPVAVEYCNSQGLNAKAGDFFELNYPSNYYDAVTMSHVVEHVPDPAKTLKEIFRILKPGGKVVMATPNSDSWMYTDLFQGDWLSLHPPAHIHIFNLDNLGKAATDAGFKLEMAATTIRNDGWVYAVSKMLKRNNRFAFGTEKPSKPLIIKGKLMQLMGWFKLGMDNKSGGELYIKGIKPK